MKNLLLLIAILGIYQITSAQLPVGKDSISGTIIMKNLMKNNGMKLFKSEVENTRSQGSFESRLTLIYREEVKVHIFYNEFNNIALITISTNTVENLGKLSNIIDEPSWILFKENGSLGVKTYKVNNYYAQLWYNKFPDTKYIYRFSNKLDNL
jgi:hypothetical protein